MLQLVTSWNLYLSSLVSWPSATPYFIFVEICPTLQSLLLMAWLDLVVFGIMWIMWNGFVRSWGIGSLTLQGKVPSHVTPSSVPIPSIQFPHMRSFWGSSTQPPSAHGFLSPTAKARWTCHHPCAEPHASLRLGVPAAAPVVSPAWWACFLRCRLDPGCSPCSALVRNDLKQASKQNSTTHLARGILTSYNTGCGNDSIMAIYIVWLEIYATI